MLGHVLSLSGEAAIYESKYALKISFSYRPVPRIRNSLRLVPCLEYLTRYLSVAFLLFPFSLSLSLSLFCFLPISHLFHLFHLARESWFRCSRLLFQREMLVCLLVMCTLEESGTFVEENGTPLEIGNAEKR